ncbi:preprotein translocase subunit YajC [Prosthecobacter dejongeii]|uniref:Sec translocon accessory complex subunit YajC n=1 Tax=Prosthecobacter dejongeii TaxID=48465 RepID=A0A7W7YI12_9BACT|nr:preprotein translocase subunit YajC [Prosthecobacter dejongeii]MBB5036417.1 preprotein translocase subunit YajC [Prosthecobacter dejongeii]
MTQIFLPFLAQAAPPGQSSSTTFIMMALMFVMMYFVLIRPQRMKQKEHEKLINNVKVGDHVILNGGEHGIITSVKERTVMVKVADNVKIEYDRAAIASISKKSDVVEATTTA